MRAAAVLNGLILELAFWSRVELGLVCFWLKKALIIVAVVQLRLTLINFWGCPHFFNLVRPIYILK